VINLTRTQLLLLLVPLLALLTVAGSRIAGVGSNQGPAESQPLARFATESGADAARAQLFVHVVGDVRRPGLFRVADGARVADALVRAGGATHRADLSAVNLAAPLADGQQVIVPRRAPPGAPVDPGATAAGSKVSLGIATIEQLDELPGIGPVTAQKIVDFRAAHGGFRTVDDLDAIPGIGPVRIDQLRELVGP
jgi:competence protein ComEA